MPMTLPKAMTEATAPDRRKRASAWRQVLIGAGMLAMVFGAIVLVSRQLGHEVYANTRQANVEKVISGSFYPTLSQWASLTVEPVATETFREELVTEGKIAV